MQMHSVQHNSLVTIIILIEWYYLQKFNVVFSGLHFCAPILVTVKRNKWHGQWFSLFYFIFFLHRILTMHLQLQCDCRVCFQLQSLLGDFRRFSKNSGSLQLLGKHTVAPRAAPSAYGKFTAGFNLWWVLIVSNSVFSVSKGITLSATTHWLYAVRGVLKNMTWNYILWFHFIRWNIEYLCFEQLLYPIRSQFHQTPLSHVLTETGWSVPGSQQLKPIGIPS